jgi:hypothetical protein
MTKITCSSSLALLANEAGYDPIEDRLRQNIRVTIEALFEEELGAFIGRCRYGRGGAKKKGYRNGHRQRQVVGTFGTETVSVPRARVEDEAGKITEWRSKALVRYQRLTKKAEALIASVYLAGTNTRRVKRALYGLFGGANGHQHAADPTARVAYVEGARTCSGIADGAPINRACPHKGLGPSLMYLGTQNVVEDDEFQVLAQLGVSNICADPRGNPHDWTLDGLLRHRERVEGFGLTLDMVQLPLSARPIEEQYSPDILGAGPDRDKQIDSICRLIENLSAAGIPSAKYNMNIIGIPRTEREAGRGGSSNSTFRWDKIDQNRAPSIVGVLDEDENWERIDYFLERVIPVAEANKVRLACHPHDPYTPPGFRGITRVLGTEWACWNDERQTQPPLVDHVARLEHFHIER